MSVLSNLRAFLYPSTCLLCQAQGDGNLDLCADCFKTLPRIDHPCPRCALPLPPGARGPCGGCQKKPPAFDAAVAVLRYESPVDWLTARLKFQGRLAHAQLLGHLLADDLIARGIGRPERIVPVPLHPRRLRERGFNQAREIARVVGRRLGVPVDARSLIRSRHTEAQMSLPARDRRKNVRGAFAVRAPLRARHVALIDDIVTTGSTVGEQARVLKRAGVETVQVWCCARAV